MNVFQVICSIFFTLLVGLVEEARQAAAFVPSSPLLHLHHHRHATSSTTTKKKLTFETTTTILTPSLITTNQQQPISTTTTTTTTSLHAAVGAAALPLSKKILLSCLVPSCLGFWKSEYGVSYAYGSAVALTSYWIYKHLIISAGSSSIASGHAFALMFYGIRLCLFLAYRELKSKRMKEMRERIEDKSKAKGSRLKRTPFVLSVAVLYFGLCSPLLISSQVSIPTSGSSIINLLLRGLVATTWGGFVFAALGDFNKSFIKATKGEDHLVTGGIFSFCRHPNYTGEIIGWTSNGLIALIAAASSSSSGSSTTTALIKVPQMVGYLAASVLGTVGLNFVLLGATKGLETKQKDTYGETDEYKKWIESTWCGFHLPQTSTEEVEEEHVTPEIEVSDTSEETGSGI